ncbi:MAG: hypothetical protein LBR34_12410 [Prevotella sp.]|jgi:hypothetical protein|nr:hypothetical protein [Prevotella sp.]
MDWIILRHKTEKKENRKRRKPALQVFRYSIILLLASCKSVLYVPVESVKTEYKDVQLHDSVFVSDSVIIRTKADTVWYEKYKTYYKDRLLRDSLVVTDSIQVPYPVEVVKEVNNLKWWQKILFGCGVAFCLLLAGFIGSKLKK